MITQEELWSVLNYYPETGEFRWKDSRGRAAKNSLAGSLRHNGYIQIRVKGALHFAHRLAFLWMKGHFPSNYVDHKNHVKTDNRWCNLREATAKENMQNRARPGGIRKRGNIFQARICDSGKEIYIGSYKTFEEAKSARRKAELDLYGDFASFSQVGI